MHWTTGPRTRDEDDEHIYQESVRATWPVAFGAFAGLTAVGWSALDRSLPLAEAAWAEAIPFWAATLALVLGLRWFLDLEVSVRERALSLRFGPRPRELAAVDLLDAAVESYDWRPYAGTGGGAFWRRRRAFTAPFVRSGVAITTRDGTRYDVASRRPEMLQQAITQLIEDHGRDE